MMTKYMIAAIGMLILLLMISIGVVKHLIESTGTLKAEVASRDQTITELTEAAKTAEAERVRLDAITQTRDDDRKLSKQRADAGKAAIRVAVKDSPDFAACAAVVVPAGITDRLRAENDHQDAGGEAIPAKPFVKRLLHTWNP